MITYDDMIRIFRWKGVYGIVCFLLQVTTFGEYFSGLYFKIHLYNVHAQSNSSYHVPEEMVDV